MITVSAKFDDKRFLKDMNNIVDYSLGFLDGIKSGKAIFLKNVGEKSVDVLKEYIDASARMNPEMLHHVYEWYREGSPEARLFDVQYSVRDGGLSLSSTFSQSKSVANGAVTPFYDKASIMEKGVPVVIKPVNAKVLKFDDGGQEIFVSGEITVDNPGGKAVEGSFEKTFDSFIKNYFSQAFLNNLGIMADLKNISVFKKNLDSGKRMGRSRGVSVGYQWITRIGA